MSYRLRKHEALAPGLRRIATEQIDDAIARLRRPGDDLDEAIHEARKCFKKVRAVVRLARDALGPTLYKRENVCFRNAGRALADLRDTHVMVTTVDDVKATFADQLDEDAFAPLRGRLAEQYQAERQRIEEGDTLGEVATTVAAARQRLQELPLDVDQFEAVRPSIARVYKRGYKGRQRAYAEPKAEHFHEWRKRVKYLWYHCRILRPLWSEMLEPLADQIHDLSDYLGDDHDLAVLRDRTSAVPLDSDQEKDRQALLGLIDQRRRALEAAARPLAARLYAEEPARFVDRLGAYWQARQMEMA